LNRAKAHTALPKPNFPMVSFYPLPKLLILGLLLFAAPIVCAQQNTNTDNETKEVIVKFTDRITQSKKREITDKVQAVLIKKFENTDTELWRIPLIVEINGQTFKGLHTISDFVKSQPGIQYIEPNHSIAIFSAPNDPFFNRLWGLQNTGQLAGLSGADISILQAWEISTGSSNITVGVLDTGIDWTHEDLVENIWQNLAEDADGDGHVIEWNGNQWVLDPGDLNGQDDDGNGYTDDLIGWDFVNNDNNPYDDNGHGTHVSGTIGARGNNGKGITGVAQNVRLMPLKIFDLAGTGYTATVKEAVDYALEMGVDITNVSWGTSQVSQTMREAFETANNNDQIVVAAAGNNNRNNDILPVYPASYDFENIIAVAAVNRHNSLTIFSNYGETSVDIGAPGGDIYSTLPGNFYGWYSGTSMAAPHVTGAVALALSACDNSTPAQIKNHLINTATPLNTPNNKGLSVLSTHQFLQEIMRPDAEFTYAADGLEVEFSAENEDDNLTYEWDFGDNSDGETDDEEAEHEYEEADNYIVCLTVSNACGSNTTCQNISINIDNILPDCMPEWQQFTSGDHILSLAEEGDYIWAGGKGGLAKINRIDDTNIFFTNNNSGLPHNRINSITIDANGTKWIGTKGGLVKFDGTNWTTYTTQNSGLRSNNVQNVAIGSTGQIWIATIGGGVALFNGQSNWITLEDSNAMLPNNDANDLILDDQAKLYVATPDNGVLKLNSNGFVDLGIGSISSEYNTVNDLNIDPTTGYLWAATDGGVAKYDGNTWQAVNLGLGGNPVLSIDIDATGKSWVGTTSGSYYFLNELWQPNYSNLGDEGSPKINAIISTENGQKWFGTNNSLKKLEAGQWSAFNQLNSPLSANIINTFTEDGNGDMWIGTSGGLVQVIGEEWIEHPDFQNIEVHALHFNNGKIWVGTNTSVSEIDIENDPSNIISHTPVNDVTNNIISDQSGRIWIGTAQNGIAVFDGNNWTNYNKNNSDLPDNTIKSLVSDATAGGEIWIATDDGVVSTDEVNWNVYRSAGSDNTATGVAIDDDGTIWVSTSNDLAHITIGQSTWTNQNIPDLPEGIQGLLIDGYGSKWLSTQEGFCKYDGYSCTVYNVTNSPLPNDDVQIIQQDNQGCFWIGTSGGLSILSALTSSFTYDKQTLCNTMTIPMRNSSTGALDQSWYINGVYLSSDPNYTHEFEEMGTYEVKLVTTNDENCTATFIEEITIGNRAEDIDLEPSINICDNIALLESNVKNMQTYRWYKNGEMLSNTRQHAALQSGIYIIEVQDWCDNWSADTLTVGLSERCIWPGDTNNDGKVTAVDVLPIGQAFGSTGPARTDAGIWDGQANPDWADEDLAYADANGDGTVDSMDLQIVYDNYGQTHGAEGLGLSSATAPGSGFSASGYVADTPPDAYLCLVPDENSLFNVDNDIVFNVELTEKSGISLECYGIAYTIKHDGDIASTDFSEAWLGANGTPDELLIFEQNAPGRLDIAQSREDQANVIGGGVVSEILILEDFPSGESTSIENLTIYSIENITLTDKDDNTIPTQGHTLVISHAGSENGNTAPIALSVKGRAATCYGEGTAEITVHSGTAPFTYEWDNGADTPTLTDLSPGLHYLTVTDAAGEEIVGMAYIEDHTGIFLDYDVTAEINNSENGSISLSPSGSNNFTYEWSTGQTDANVAGLRAGTYTVTITNEVGCQKIENIVVSGRLRVKPKVILQGAFDPATGLMRGDLQLRDFLPLISPYGTGESVSVNAFLALDPNDIVVDWVAVELRDKNTVKLIARQTAFLQRDGDVVALDGSDAVKFDNVPEDEYYIAIRHRNHFSVVSENAPFFGRSAVIYDFTQSPDANYPSYPLPQVAPGVYAVHVGNATDNILDPREDINGDDKLQWSSKNGNFGVYNSRDFSLDGDINGADRIIWEPNNGKFNQLPD